MRRFHYRLPHQALSERVVLVHPDIPRRIRALWSVLLNAKKETGGHSVD
jgi:hypothetical protein